MFLLPGGYDDGAAEAKAVTRDYVLDLDDSGPPLLSVFGGKITTARHLAEEACARLGGPLGFTAQHVTRNRAFPGGDIKDFSQFLADAHGRYGFLGPDRLERMAHAYGSRLDIMLAGVTRLEAMGTDLGGGLTEVEARWMGDREWAVSADDALDRRSKLGLRMTPEERADFTTQWEALL